MRRPDEEEERLRSVALQNAQAILAARQRAERELLEAKEALELKTVELATTLSMMRATLESTTDGILVTDDTGRVTDYNDNIVRMWGMPADLFEGGDHGDVLSAISREFADPDAYLRRIDEIQALGSAETFDVLELASGRVFERFSRVQRVDDRNVGRVWSFRDITDRRATEETLRAETRLFELLNRTGRTLASQLDLRALVQAVTDAATELSGAQFGAFFYTNQDGEGRFDLFTLSGAPREAFEKFGPPRATPLFGPTFRGEGPIRSDDVLADPRYGKLGPHHGMPIGHLPVRSYLAVPVISRDGTAIGGLFFGHAEPGVFSERTERLIAGIATQASIAMDNARLFEATQRAAEDRMALLESERVARAESERIGNIKDQFLATLSHELRTPLSAILGWATILRRRAMNEDELHQGLEIIERNARIQTQLIEDLLDMSRINSGKVRLDIQPLEPASLIESALETVRPAAEARGVRLETVLDQAAGPISGDASRLQQVVWNLLSNAIKFTPRGGRVQVVLQRLDSHVEIRVADTGIGIAPEFLPQVFDRFRQADASTTRVHGGLGLGLSIVKNLVELHGGTVWATSPGEGKGTTFVVSLPLAVLHRSARQEPDPESPPRDAEKSSGSADLSGLRVLVVDDAADARTLIRSVLVDCGAEVITASSAEEALRLLREERPNVLVSDIGMPGADGYDLIRQVRELPEGAGGRIPSVALTAFARSEDRTRALRAGFQVHLAKPVDPVELVATVASVAGRSGNLARG